jgi:serine/threonine protein phosphatase 1
MNQLKQSDGRIFAIGDIHGEMDRLERLMARLPYDEKRDVLIFLGDYINRGPRSSDVISYLIDLKTRARNVVTLLGNHEYELLKYAGHQEDFSLRLLRYMGIEETLKSYRRSAAWRLSDLSFMPREHRRFLEELSPYSQLGDYLFVHAGLEPGKSLVENKVERMVNIRGGFLASDETWEGIVVFGHTPFETPLVTSTKIGIDTGATYGNMLTAVELPRLRFFHA